MALIALCNAFHFSLQPTNSQPTNSENHPGAIAVQPFALPLVLVNGDNNVPRTAVARFFPNSPRIPDVSRRAQRDPPPESRNRPSADQSGRFGKNAPFRSRRFP